MSDLGRRDPGYDVLLAAGLIHDPMARNGTDAPAHTDADLIEDASDLHPLSEPSKWPAIALTTKQIRRLPPPEWVLRDLMALGSISMMYGPSGVGKSFVTGAMMYSIALKRSFFGHEADSAGPVVYVVGEGVAGVGQRLSAYAEHHGIDIDDAPVTWIPQAVNLANAAESATFAQFCADIGAKAIAFDTLARCAVGADENSSRDMGLVVANLDYIKTTTNAAILLVHHSGKSIENGARGSSALKAAIDTEFELTGGDGKLLLTNTKQRNAAEALPLRLELKPVGDSCAVIAGHGYDKTVTQAEMQTLEALRTVQVPGGVSTAVWRVIVGGSEATFYRHRKKLVDAGLVIVAGTEKQPKYLVSES